MSRPLIGVTTSSRSGWRIYPLVNLNLWLAGARGVRWGAGRPSDLAAVDGVIEIPTFGTKNSLNVASAAAIVAFEALRQWGKL